MTEETKQELTVEEKLDYLKGEIMIRDKANQARDQELTNAFLMVSQSIAVVSAKIDTALDFLVKQGIEKEELMKAVEENVKRTLETQAKAMREAQEQRQNNNEVSTEETPAEGLDTTKTA